MGDLTQSDQGALPTTQELQYLSREMTDEWLPVSRDLGITNGELYNIRRNNQGHEQETIYQMLLLWTHKEGSRATKSKLAKALQNNRRADLSDYILRGIKPK